ncbi:hypothetical protein Y024_5762 [Burkholderia pseudomallei TSV44]|nr:hypothetical protein Y024_5762 [Burkholderia pseudomallei TSV44]
MPPAGPPPFTLAWLGAWGGRHARASHKAARAPRGG